MFAEFSKLYLKNGVTETAEVVNTVFAVNSVVWRKKTSISFFMLQHQSDWTINSSGQKKLKICFSLVPVKKKQVSRAFGTD